jgi:hydrogenase maturation protease
MAPRVLVAGIGNLFLGDDGFGPEVVRRLAAALPPAPDPSDGAENPSAFGADAVALPPGVTVTDYGIRGMHLVYDLLAGYDALVVVDALPAAGSPGELVVLEVGPDDLGPGEFDAHGMNPMAVLAGLTRLGGTLPPTYVVGYRTTDVDERIGLSPAATAAIPAAITAIQALLARIGTDQPAASGRY